jgi:hypothetical protein
MPPTLENAVGSFWLDDDGLLRVIANGVDQTRADAEDSLRILAELGGSKRRPAVIDVSKVKVFERGARTVYAGPQAARVFTSVALVVASSPLARALTSFIISVGRPSFPTRLFGTAEEAAAWSRGFRSTD